jgi:hypothetical protein
VESYRNDDDRICHRTILNVGFMEDTTAKLNKIQKHLTHKHEHTQLLFEETDPVVKKYVDELWQRIIDAKRSDIIPFDQRARLVDTINHRDVREIGAEWIGYHTWEKDEARHGDKSEGLGVY